MSRSVSIRELLALAYAAEANEVSIHDGDPGTTGANELAGSTRQPLTWTAGTEDGQVVADQVTFVIPDGTLLTHVGIWSTDGTYRDSRANEVDFDTGGQYSITLTYTQI